MTSSISSRVLDTTPETPAGRYSLLLTTDADEVRAAQRLRHDVFGDELGATLHSRVPGLDVDRFDEFCDHLVVREDATGRVVGTYRMLPPARAREAGALYADGEFDLTSLDGLRPELVETGRSCVHPDHRNGAVVSLVWAGLARYMLLSGNRWLAGCASVPLDGEDGADGALAAGVWERVKATHLAPDLYRVAPHNPWRPGPVVRSGRLAMPPLLRGYLRLGTWIGGPPAHDPDFRCADFFVLLDVQHLDQRYLRYFLGAIA
ncbi:GNAT family N-acetyltransferase [Pseudonocardia sp. D17]|uniref:GNAT family N-acetyltransferase n=1 Tax=Pseudonocardia sp. D17 TaxID=882661 RepID=UPI0030CA8877